MSKKKEYSDFGCPCCGHRLPVGALQSGRCGICYHRFTTEDVVNDSLDPPDWHSETPDLPPTEDEGEIIT